MTVARAARLAVARTCRDCGCFPCRCGREQPDEHAFALRIAPCACGGPAIASGGPVSNVAAAIQVHNATKEHVAWRAAREEVATAV